MPVNIHSISTQIHSPPKVPSQRLTSIRTQLNSRARRIILRRTDKVRAGPVLIRQPNQTVRVRIVLGPPQLIQPFGRILGERGPRVLHERRHLVLGLGRRDAGNGVVVAEDHLEVGAMVGATAVVEAQVVPVAEVAVLPGGDAVGAALLGCEHVGTSEG